MPTLYEITENFRAVFTSLEENGGEITEEISEQMGTLETDLELKIDGYCKRIRDLEGDAAKFKAEEERIAIRRKSMEREVRSLKEWMLVCLKAIKLDQVKTGTFSVRIQQSAPVVVIYDEGLISDRFKMASLDMLLSELPAEFISKADIRINKTKIAAFIKEGGYMAGAHLESNDYLRIR